MAKNTLAIAQMLPPHHTAVNTDFGEREEGRGWEKRGS